MTVAYWVANDFVANYPAPARGLIYGENIEAWGAGMYRLRWNYIANHGNRDAAYNFGVFLNGGLVGLTDGLEYPLGDGVINNAARVDVLPLSEFEDGDTTLVYWDASSSGVRLYWNQPLGNITTGTGGVGANGSYTVAAASWATNQFTNARLYVDSTYYTITANNGTVLTVSENLTGAAASWAIVNKADNQEDFYSYVLYYDEGDAGGDIDVEYQEVIGITNTELLIDDLATGTYRFRIAYKDHYGIESGFSALYTTVTIAEQPKALVEPAITYSSATRKATIAWTNPTGQIATVNGVAIYCNYAIPFGFPSGTESDMPSLNPIMRWGLESHSATSWESQELWEGQFLFIVRTVTKYGLESSYDVLELTLAKTGSDLLQVTDPPSAPIDIDGEITGSGTADVSCFFAGTDATAIRLYKDDVLEDTLGGVESGTGGVGGSNSYAVSGAGWGVNQWANRYLTVDGSDYLISANTADTLTVDGDLTGAAASWEIEHRSFDYEFSVTGLADATDYEFYCTAVSADGQESVKSESITLRGDTSAPTGDYLIYSEVL